MKKSLIITVLSIAAMVAASSNAVAQTNDADTVSVPVEYEIVDSVIYTPAQVMDSTLRGKNIFEILADEPDGLSSVFELNQSQDITESFDRYVRKNHSRSIVGYRIRIFFDNSKTARSYSAGVLGSFRNLYPGVRAYRSYANPYFKVTVGDFRTRSEAMAFLQSVKKHFPSAFVVKESINYPPIDKNRPVIADTIQITRPKTVIE